MNLTDDLKDLKSAAEKTTINGFLLERKSKKDTDPGYYRHLEETGTLARILGNLIATLTANSIKVLTHLPGTVDYYEVDFINAISYTEAVTEIVRQWHNYTIELLQCAEPEKLIKAWMLDYRYPPHLEYREACDELRAAVNLDKTINDEMTMYAEKVEKIARLAAAYEARKEGK